MKTKHILAVLSACGMFAVAQAEIVANIGATSNYVWRGATQTGDDAAIQGGLDYAGDFAQEIGFYAGTWASNVDFGAAGGEVEVDLYGGISGELESIGWDLGLIYYVYPDSDDANFLEVAGSISFEMLSAGLNYNVASEVNETAAANQFVEGDLYLWVNGSIDLPAETFGEGYSFGVTVGHYSFDEDGQAGTDLDYTHGLFDLSKDAGDFGTFTFSVSVAGDEANGGDDDAKVFVSWGKEF